MTKILPQTLEWRGGKIIVLSDLEQSERRIKVEKVKGVMRKMSRRRATGPKRSLLNFERARAEQV